MLLSVFLKAHRWDILVISLVLLVSIVFVLLSLVNRVPGGYVEVEINGEFVDRYPLMLDGEYVLNGGTNTLTIKNGEAYMSASNCPDHTCEHSGKAKYVGQTIICLPNFVTVAIVGESDDAVDFVS